MSLTVPDLKTLDAAAVAQAQADLTQRLSEAFPQIDLDRRVFHDFLIQLTGVAWAALRQSAAAVEAASSVQDVLADPAAADEALVDRLLSNFRITRLPGGAASGQVAVVLTSSTPVVVPAGASFASGSATFSTTAAYAVRTSSAAVTGPTDRVLSPLGDGRYAFTVPVACDVVGPAGMLRRGAAVTPGFLIPQLSQAYAASDFSGGVAAETNAALMARMQAGIAAKCFGGRGNVAALLASLPDFRLVGASVVGAGDAEMTRDRRTPFPVSLFGRIDVYCRTAALPATLVLTKAAVLVGSDVGGGLWRATIGRDEAPGFYQTLQIVRPVDPPLSTGFEVVSDVRSYSPQPGWSPDVVGGAEAAYSRFQAAAVTFRDPQTPLAGLTVGASTADYLIAVSCMPGLAAAQAMLGGREVRDPGGDVLVKAPVPCFLRISLDVVKPPAAPAPDVAAIREAVATAVNALAFPGAVYAYQAADAASPLLPSGTVVGKVSMFGRIRRPDGSSAYVQDSRNAGVVRVPDEPEAGVTARTVSFFLDPADVDVVVKDMASNEA